jgi:hypothetical protein
MSGAGTDEVGGDCMTCEEGTDERCRESRRSCGHHCNCAWTHAICHWCDAEFGDTAVFPDEAMADA